MWNGQSWRYVVTGSTAKATFMCLTKNRCELIG
jgi:hypothetical protein